MSILGYVVVEFNQASGQPRVDSYSGFGGDIYRDKVEAEQILEDTRFTASRSPRRETYVLAEVRRIGEPA